MFIYREFVQNDNFGGVFLGVFLWRLLYYLEINVVEQQTDHVRRTFAASQPFTNTSVRFRSDATSSSSCDAPFIPVQSSDDLNGPMNAATLSLVQNSVVGGQVRQYEARCS